MNKILIAVFVWVVLSTSVIIWSNIRECNTYGEMTGMETTIKAGECYAKTTNGWFLKNQIRVEK